MQHIKKEILEKFCNDPSDSFELPDELIEHINHCQFCSNRLKEIITFQSNIEKFLSITPSRKLKQFVNSIRPVLIAYPVLTDVNLRPQNYSVYLAEGKSKKLSISNKNIEYYGSFITNKGEYLVRIIKNLTTKEYFLYLLADDMDKCRDKNLAIPTVDKIFKTDVHGKVKLGRILLPDIDQLRVKILL